MRHYDKKTIDLSAYPVYQKIQFRGVKIDLEQRGIYVENVIKHLLLIYLKLIDLRKGDNLDILENISNQEQY